MGDKFNVMAQLKNPSVIKEEEKVVLVITGIFRRGRSKV